MNFLKRLFARAGPMVPPDEHEDFVPPLPPLEVLRPPAGFRFATHPPDMAQLVHLDNEHPYRNARRHERVVIIEGPISRQFLGEGRVIGRMGSNDRRANSVRPAEIYGHPEGYPGIYFINEHGDEEWRPAQNFHRRVDGVLQFTR